MTDTIEKYTNRNGVKFDITFNEKEMCLTDMWRAAGSDPSKEVARWRSSAWGREVITAVVNARNDRNKVDGTSSPIDSDRLFRVVRGGQQEQGTWACPELGVAYAHFLSADFYAWHIRHVILPYFQGGLQPKAVDNKFMSFEDNNIGRCQLERSILGVIHRSGRITDEQATDELLRIARKYLSADFLSSSNHGAAVITRPSQPQPAIVVGPLVSLPDGARIQMPTNRTGRFLASGWSHATEDFRAHASQEAWKLHKDLCAARDAYRQARRLTTSPEEVSYETLTEELTTALRALGVWPLEGKKRNSYRPDWAGQGTFIRANTTIIRTNAPTHFGSDVGETSKHPQVYLGDALIVAATQWFREQTLVEEKKSQAHEEAQAKAKEEKDRRTAEALQRRADKAKKAESIRQRRDARIATGKGTARDFKMYEREHGKTPLSAPSP